MLAASKSGVGGGGRTPRLQDIDLTDEWGLRKSIGALILQHGDEIPTYCYCCGGVYVEENRNQYWVSENCDLFSCRSKSIGFSFPFLSFPFLFLIN